jgi:DNA-binding NarL/FixJ family response regulator
MNSDHAILVMIAAPVGIMSSSLHTFLQTLPDVKVVEHCTDQTGTLSAIRNHWPNLLIIDLDMVMNESEIGNTLEEFIGQVRSLNPETQIIVIVNSLKQKQSAVISGADQVLMKGMLEVPLAQVCSPVLNDLPIPSREGFCRSRKHPASPERSVG